MSLIECIDNDNLWEQYIPESWEGVFRDARKEISRVAGILREKLPVYYPNKEDLFNAFHATKLQNVKVVILGQDPYHGASVINGKTMPQAMGMSFSVRKGDAIPSSLRNIMKELTTDITFYESPDHGDLTFWAEQGVLLLNTCLTVSPGKPDSHRKIWLDFIKKVFKGIADVNPSCIYLLWGAKAQSMISLIGGSGVFLEAAHPSGMSASRGFFGCKHFSKCNTLLREQGKTEIYWDEKTFLEKKDKKDMEPEEEKVVLPIVKLVPVKKPVKKTPVKRPIKFVMEDDAEDTDARKVDVKEPEKSMVRKRTAIRFAEKKPIKFVMEDEVEKTVEIEKVDTIVEAEKVDTCTEVVDDTEVEQVVVCTDDTPKIQKMEQPIKKITPSNPKKKFILPPLSRNPIPSIKKKVTELPVLVPLEDRIVPNIISFGL